MSTINSQSLQYVDPLQALVPSEGPKGIPILLDFSGSMTEYDLDLTLPVDQKKISMIQTIYIDLSRSGATDLTITMNGSNQVIQAKAGTQGYYSVLSPYPPRFTFTSSASSAIVPVFLLNIPVPGVVWSV